jgi:hypothetical protein
MTVAAFLPAWLRRRVVRLRGRIDPDSPRQEGTDVELGHVRLGDIDCDGRFIGYISEGGVPYPTRADAEIDEASSDYFDAWWEWYNGGERGLAPDPQEYIAPYCSPENIQAAIAECHRRVAQMKRLMYPGWRTIGGAEGRHPDPV